MKNEAMENKQAGAAAERGAFADRGTFIELASGRAHRVHPADATRPLRERLAGEPLLLVMLAREKAATVRVAFDEAGRPRIGETRQVAGRGQGELVRVLQAEARATGARWAMAVFALGWQAVLGTRSARPGTDGQPFDRFRLTLEQPELFCAQPQPDALYACVDHPTLDRSVLFSVRRRDVEEVLHDLRTAGLGVAAVRIGVASQLESWLAAQGAAGLERDLLVSDSLGVLLLQIEQGEFRAPAGTGGGTDSRPRQAAARPNDTGADAIRFLKEQARGRVSFLGSAELASIAQAGTGGSDIEVVRAPDGEWNDAVSAALSDSVRHDLNPDLREERPPLAGFWRKWVVAALAVAAVLVVTIGVNLWQVARAQWKLQEEESRAEAQRARREKAESRLRAVAGERRQALRLRSWIVRNYHAQPLAHDILRSLPGEVGLERLSANLEEGNAQMTLEFTLLGDDGAQAAACRQIERAVIGRSLQIGERHAPASTARGAHHRWRLLLPAAAWDDGNNEGDGAGISPAVLPAPLGRQSFPAIERSHSR